MTKIQWTEKTWNPIRGCSIVSPGCVNCYAMKMAHRFSGPGMPYEGLTVLKSHGPTWTGKVVCDEKKLDDPLHWKKPCRIFVNSMSDLFHEGVPMSFLNRVFRTMLSCPQHTFQILTKRPLRMLAYMSQRAVIPSNAWLGVSVEDQKTADERIPLLRQTPAAVRWVSYEPMLAPVVFTDYLPVKCCPPPYLDWIVCGGESGPGARPLRLQWVRDVIGQCKANHTPVFVKQLGGRWRAEPVRVKVKDRKGGDMAEWPEDLRVREYPR